MPAYYTHSRRRGTEVDLPPSSMRGKQLHQRLVVYVAEGPDRSLSLQQGHEADCAERACSRHPVQPEAMGPGDAGYRQVPCEYLADAPVLHPTPVPHARLTSERYHLAKRQYRRRPVHCPQKECRLLKWMRDEC